MKRNDERYGKGGKIPYAAPEIEAYEITVEQGFALSGVTTYNGTEGTEDTGSDYEATGW